MTNEKQSDQKPSKENREIYNQHYLESNHRIHLNATLYCNVFVIFSAIGLIFSIMLVMKLTMIFFTVAVICFLLSFFSGDMAINKDLYVAQNYYLKNKFDRKTHKSSSIYNAITNILNWLSLIFCSIGLICLLINLCTINL